ncbi:MAG TPA: hypothetical protein VFR85_05990 [Anaeromyxobacteraceae bacterium]|nr:hypothetical protein [Anaeromyxobacteraceae bacterium]
MTKLARLAAVAALALHASGASAGGDSPAGGAGAAAPAEPAATAKRGVAGRVSFKQGSKSFQLPLETADVEVTDLRGRRQYHVSLVYRDAKNRTFAIAFVHTGPGPVPDRLLSDLTVSTPAGLSKLQPGASVCNLVLAVLDPSRVEGKASCSGLTDFGGERRSPDVTQVKFTASR